MKKRILSFLLIAAVVLTVAGNAFCFTVSFADPYSSAVKIVNADRIGNIAYELYKMDVTYSDNLLKFDIFSNYPEAGTNIQSGAWFTKPADLRIAVGSDIFGLAFRDHDTFTKGTLYRTNEWYMSGYDRPGNGYIWHHDKPVAIKTIFEEISTNSVSWNTPSGDMGIYKISAEFDPRDILPDDFQGDIEIFYGGATCANDHIGGSISITSTSTVVPEPASLSLLGLGVLGLLGCIKKKR
ncbi:MAG: PEP-CTERM sorting domain-containing protein [Candidatus Omnitrophica bacterium]|nr:PEP-CTERM sorting domain-containing protein [Candidatus Omnitrophota bacterium]